MKFWISFLSTLFMIHQGDQTSDNIHKDSISLSKKSLTLLEEALTLHARRKRAEPLTTSSSPNLFTDGLQWTRDKPPPTNSSDRIPLYLAGLFSLNGSWDGSGVLIGADLALKHINDNRKILPGYKLILSVSDSQCNRGVGIQKLFQHIFNDPQELMIIGPGCSTVAEAVASTAHFWNLITMSPTAASPALSRRSSYPKFFRIIPAETLQNPTRISLMKLYNWTRVATIHQNDEIFSLTMDDLLTRFKENNITAISSESFDEDPQNQVENLKNKDSKIIVANAFAPDMRKIMCEAYKKRLYGKGYVWMLIGWYNADWHLQDNSLLDCSLDEMKEVVESSMYIATQSKLTGREDVMTVAEMTISQYRTLLGEHAKKLHDEFGFTFIEQANYGYDSIWAVALALNKSIDILKKKSFVDGKLRSLEKFTYTDNEMVQVFSSSLENINFEGVSGPVCFSEGDRIGVVNIEQFRGQCSDGWISYGRFCYLFVATQKSRDGAASYCRDEESFLVSILSEEENEALINIHQEESLSKMNQWWLSLKTTIDGNFSWNAGPESSTPWKRWNNEPKGEAVMLDDDATETDSCFVMDFSSKLWRPVTCQGSSFPFICKQNADFKEVVIAEDDVAKNKINWTNGIIWPGGGDEVPLDHTPRIIFKEVKIYKGIPSVVYIINCIVAAIGILFSTICLLFNLKFRKQRFIKMSSPNLNSLIIVGCIMVYISTCMVGWDSPNVDHTTFLRFCKARVWFFSTGFVLSFGSMFSKTWRVYKVASLKNPHRVIINDHHLFVMVGAMLLLNTILLLLWFVLSPMRVEETMLQEVKDDQNHVIWQPYILSCTSKHSLYFEGAIYFCDALILTFGVFLAWETREVNIPALNDSKLIGICVYNVVLLSSITAGVNLVLKKNPFVSYMFTSATKMFCTSVSLVVIFIPKMISVKRYPDGEPVTTMKNTPASNITASSDRDVELKDEISQLKTQIQKLQAENNQTRSGFGFWFRTTVCAFCGDTMGAANEAVMESNDTLTSSAN